MFPDEWLKLAPYQRGIDSETGLVNEDANGLERFEMTKLSIKQTACKISNTDLSKATR